MTSQKKSAKTLDDDEVLEGAIFTIKQTRHLKVIVIVMGLMLVFGFIALAIAVMSKAGKKKTTAPKMQPPSTEKAVNSLTPTAFSSTTNLQADITPKLPKGAKVLSYKLLGNHMVLHITATNANQIVVLDLTTGQIKSRIHLPIK